MLEARLARIEDLNDVIFPEFDMPPLSEPAQRKLRISRFVVSVYWLAIFIASHVPLAPKETETHGDKLFHFGAFAVLAYLIAWYQGQLGAITRASYLVIFAVVAIYGAFDEWSQTLVQGRSAELLDWIADIVGALVGLIAYAAYDKWFRKSSASVDLGIVSEVD